MKQDWKRNAVFIITWILTGTVSAQTTNEFTVKQAVDYAMQNSVQVRNALLDIQLQKQMNKEITSAAFPQLTGNASVTNYLDIPTSLIPSEITGGTPGTYFPVQFGTKYSATGGFDLNQLLFDGQVFVGLQARSASIRYMQAQAEVTKEQIAVNVQKIYYQLVVGRQQMTSIDANIERFEKLLSDVTEIYNNGMAERLDIDKVSVQLNNLRTEKLRVQNQLDAGNAGLKFLMNMPQKNNLVLVDSLSEDQIKEGILDPSFNYSDRKEYKALEEAMKLGQYNIKRHRLSYLPTVSAFATYNKNAQRSEFDFFKSGPWFTTSFIGLRLNVPIFDGFAKRARVNTAKIELQKLKNNSEQLRAQIDQDMVTANLMIATALATMDNQRRNMQLAEQVYNTTKLKFEQGLGSNQEIYTAQTELRIAQNNYYGALYDAVIARIDYLQATGKL
jgi:outer membrane protein TolC